MGNVRTFLRIMFAIIPTIISCISYFVKQQYFPIKNHEIVVSISDGITKHMQGQPAFDPITNQRVVIEEYSVSEQCIVDLFDHFTYSQIIWLLEPNTILKKHKKINSKNRRMSFQAVSNLNFDVKDFLNKLQSAKGIKVKNNVIAPIASPKDARSEITSSSVRIISDPQTNTITTSYFKSKGKKNDCTNLLWYCLSLLCRIWCFIDNSFAA